MKAIEESSEQIEQSQLEFITYERLYEQELGAITRRTEVIFLNYAFKFWLLFNKLFFSINI